MNKSQRLGLRILMLSAFLSAGAAVLGVHATMKERAKETAAKVDARLAENPCSCCCLPGEGE